MINGINKRQTMIDTLPLMMNSLATPILAIQPTTPNGTPMEGMLRINVIEIKASAVS
jgi:hypothetical protein